MSLQVLGFNTMRCCAFHNVDQKNDFRIDEQVRIMAGVIRGKLEGYTPMVLR